MSRLFIALTLCLVGCAHGVDDYVAPAPTIDAGIDAAVPSLGSIDHSCDYTLNGRICQDLVSVDHYNAPGVVLAQYAMSCEDPNVAFNDNRCMLWSLRSSNGEGLCYPDCWAWCCDPPQPKVIP